MKIIELEILRSLKATTVKELQKKKIPYPRLNRLDERLSEYIGEVILFPDRHNLYEILSIKRFFYMYGKYELRDVEVKKFIAVYEFLKFPGVKGATRYKLTPVQVFQFTNILGFYHKGSSRRVIREALLFLPRKFSKTTSVAALAVDDLLFGDANSQSYVAANSYNQAHICFEVIQSVLKNLDPAMKRFKVNREKVFNLQRGKTSFVECLASKADKLDGLNASVVILDEFAQSESADLKNVLTSSMGARENPLTITITTASSKRDTPFIEMLDAYKAILRGEIENDSIFAHIFEPDVDDEEGDVNTWYKVQPHLGVTCRLEFYEDEWKKAQLTSDNMKEFRNKLLNIFAQDAKKEWVTADRISANYMDYEYSRLAGVRAVTTVDLSVSDDFSAVTHMLYMPDRHINGIMSPFHSITFFYIPEETLSGHVNSELYRRWVASGHMRTIKGRTIDYDVIINDILSMPFCILGIGYDPYKSLEFVKKLELTPNVGPSYLYPIPQTYGAFTSPVESFELSLFNGRITFEPNPITAYCFNNAVIDEDRLENRKPIKYSPNNKIDGAITNVMCFWMLNNLKTII